MSTTAAADKTVLVIDKSGLLKEVKIKSNSQKDLYKKAGLKSAEGFQEQFMWDVDWEDTRYSISLYAKKKGKTGKNMFNFPAPLEEEVFYGNAILLNNLGSLSIADWENLFEVICEKYDENGEDESVSSSSTESDEEEADEIDEDLAEDDVVGETKAGVEAEFAEEAAQYLDCTKELEPEEYL